MKAGRTAVTASALAMAAAAGKRLYKKQARPDCPALEGQVWRAKRQLVCGQNTTSFLLFRPTGG